MWPALVSTKFVMSVCRMSLDMGSVLRYGERPYCSPRAELTRQVTLTESANTHRVVPPLQKKKPTPKLRVVPSSTASYQTQGATLLLPSVLQVPVAAEQ